MDQASSDPPVPVDERMDRLELRVRDGRPDHGCHVIAVDEIDESAISAGTWSSGGGTQLASDGLLPRPPIQLCTWRKRPAMTRSGP